MDASERFAGHSKNTSAWSTHYIDKEKAGKKTPEEVAIIVADAIEEINRGSVEPLDILIRKKNNPPERFLI